MHQISNQYLSIGINPTGAELCSINKLGTDTEYIWQANPDIWNSHAPNLFPVIGVLKNGEYFFEGRKYSLPKHGFIRYNENIRLKERSDDQLVFELAFSEETLKMYPFKFRFEISFALKGKSVVVEHAIQNLDDNSSMYFSLGGHPAFNAPLYEGETYEDYYLEFDRSLDLETFLLNENGLVSNKTSAIEENTRKLELHKSLFDNDALIFRKISSKNVSLKSKKSGTILSVEYEDFKNLGVWAKPAAPFVCIEPWLGIADVEGTNQDLKTKEGIIELMPSEEFHASYTISIE